MQALGGILIVIGMVAAAYWLLIGPMLWAPIGILMFCFGAVLCGFGVVCDAIQKSTDRIVAAMQPATPADTPPTAASETTTPQ